jgi:hypothetical protein
MKDGLPAGTSGVTARFSSSGYYWGSLSLNTGLGRSAIVALKGLFIDIC